MALSTRLQQPDPCVSVIVPIHNVAGHVRGCIESLMGQTLTDFEVLVIDDGSTDDSAAITQEAIGPDARFRLIRQENRGLSGARNTGLELARGAFIAFVDSDDRVMPDYLMQLWQALDRTGADWVACAVASHYADGSGESHSAIHGAASLGDHPVERRYRFESWNDVIRHFPSAWNKLYRRELIDGLRFDEGTWFEDHVFFYRAATRTDHLLHLPQALYLQTRERPGQITASDDDRVFQQFDVLRRMQTVMRESDLPGADTAFEKIASRLVFERSTALRDPDRRRRFARASAGFLRDHGLSYSPLWDSGIGRAWGLEMDGESVLSVVLPWDGTDPGALASTFESLRAQHVPGFELLLVCDRPETAQAARKVAETDGGAPGDLKILTCSPGTPKGSGPVRNHGLEQATGRYVVFLAAGDRLHPRALQDWAETMLRHKADLGLSPVFLAGAPGPSAPELHSRFVDLRGFPGGKLPGPGPLPLSPEQALGLDLGLGGRIFRRAHLKEQGLRCSDGARSGWALTLGAAVLAERVVHIPWVGLTLARPRSDETAPTRAIWTGHDALCRALPKAAATRLPKGWQRRLFARAMRGGLPLSRPAGRKAQIAWAARLLRAALAAATRGFARSRIDPAGFDPMIGPRFLMLLDPARLLRRILRRPDHGLALMPPMPQAGGDAKTGCAETAPMVLFPFRTRAFLRFQVDFHDAPFANLSFYGPGRVHIPFHISLRFQEGLVVCNDSHPDGQWRAERRCHAALPRHGARVEIRLDPHRARVWLNGEKIFDLGRRSPFSRAGVKGLDTITYLQAEGGVQLLDLLPERPGLALSLDPRLVLRRLGNADDHRLSASHDETGVELLPADLEQGQPAMQAGFPGRAWLGVAPDAPLELVLSDAQGNTHASPLRISRTDLAQQIDRLLDLGPSRSDSALLMQIFEHVRYGGLLPLLSATTRTRVERLARSFDLEEFLNPPNEVAAWEMAEVPEEIAPAIQPENAAQLRSALARFADSQRSSPRPDPLEVVAGLALPPDERRGLFLALSDVFCREGQDVPALAAMARSENLPPLQPSQEQWTNSAMLPYLLLDGRVAEVRRLLRDLSRPDETEGWVVTPAVAWVARHVIETPSISEADGADILRSFMDFVDNRLWDYWERAHCRELTRTAVALVLAFPRLPQTIQRDIVPFCIRAYGLSRLFWRMLDDAGKMVSVLPPELGRARSAFSDLAEAVESVPSDPARIERALRRLDGLGTCEATRFRRELLGPLGLPIEDGAELDIGTVLRLPRGQAEAATRHMAHPGSAGVTPEVSGLVARAFPDLYPELPRAPDLDLQQLAAGEIASVLAQPGTEIAANRLDALLGHLAPLCEEASRFLGIGLAITLLTGLSKQEVHSATVARITQWVLDLVAKFDDECREALSIATPPRMALMALEAADAPLAVTLRDALRLQDVPTLPSDTRIAPASPLFDTIVVVFSCRAYLDSRIPALREGWLRLLDGLGVPYIVVVGDGDGELDGDVVYLDAPDDYEGLPQKTLAAIRWVHDNTGFAHMLKIDDDCFVNAPLFFQTLSYRCFDYYGRTLSRVPGQMDRAWHQAKSTSDRGRFELDKSTEPSRYADGGSGYALSRTAMSAALDAAASADGRKLISLSFMEDKMLGDLLALRGIHVADQDYLTSVRRRTFDTAIPVPSWQNGFFPSQSAPVAMVHMDTHQGQAQIIERLDRHGLWPRKIWPSFQDVKLGHQSNALELISSDDSVARARAADVAVVACMRNEMFMLPHFLAHYRKLGAGAFLIADNLSDDGTLEYLAEQPDVALFSVDTDYRLSRYGVAWQQAMMAAFRTGKWSLVADADELLVWQKNQRQTLPDLLAGPDWACADAARIFMLDMYPRDRLENADFSSGDLFAEAGFADRVPFRTNTLALGPFSNMPTWTSALRHRLIPYSRPELFVAQKIALLRYRPWMRLSAGLHFVGDVTLAPQELLFAHFKYNAEFRRKAKVEVARGQHFNDAEEYRKYLALASEGRDVIYDPELSAPWHESAFVQARLTDQE